MSNILLINKDTFDEEVWQCKTDFTQEKYNVWLKETAIKALQRIYDILEYSELTNSADDYILGDVINMLSNTEIKTDNH